MDRGGVSVIWPGGSSSQCPPPPSLESQPRRARGPCDLARLIFRGQAPPRASLESQYGPGWGSWNLARWPLRRSVVTRVIR